MAVALLPLPSPVLPLPVPVLFVLPSVVVVLELLVELCDEELPAPVPVPAAPAPAARRPAGSLRRRRCRRCRRCLVTNRPSCPNEMIGSNGAICAGGAAHRAGHHQQAGAEEHQAEAEQGVLLAGRTRPGESGRAGGRLDPGGCAARPDRRRRWGRGG